MPIPLASAAKVLFKEYQQLQKEPLEGFCIIDADESNIYEWIVAIFGPPSTIYAGGYFKALIKFPGDYPFSPPTFRFTTKMWHPNIYENGEVCISILHPPTNTIQGGELPQERWNPTQSVRTVIMSIISLLNEPNTFSPANVDASIMYRDYTKSTNKDKVQPYLNFVNKTIEDSQKEAVKDGVVIPNDEKEYCIVGRRNSMTSRSSLALGENMNRRETSSRSADSKESKSSSSIFHSYDEYTSSPNEDNDDSSEEQEQLEEDGADMTVDDGVSN